MKEGSKNTSSEKHTEITFIISRIEKQKRDDERVSVYLDNTFAFGIEREVLLQHNLQEGDEISESMIEDVLLAEEKIRVRDKTLVLLSYRAHAVAEIRKKLKKRGYSSWSIEYVIEDFKRIGFLNDSTYAFDYAQSRLRSRPMAKRLLQQELNLRGIEKSLARQAIEHAYENRSEHDVAFSIAERKYDRIKIANKKAKKKFTDFLIRRGFDWATVSAVVGEFVWENEI